MFLRFTGQKTGFDTASLDGCHSLIKFLHFDPHAGIIAIYNVWDVNVLTLLHVDFYSDVLSRSVEVDVVLPEGPVPQAGHPTLFLLHGMTDDHSIWQRRTSIERYADDRHVAVIMPTTRLGWYTNTYAGERYFDYISDELVHNLRRMLPCLSRRREDTFVAGLSMGGYGAMCCALKRPDVFCKAAALSAAMDVVVLAQDPLPLGKPFCWEDIFGPVDQIAGSEYDLFPMAEKLTKNRPEIWMWCGTEDDLYPMNLKMRNHLRKLGYTLHYHESPGNHTWKYWNREIQNVLKWLRPGEEDEVCL